MFFRSVLAILLSSVSVSCQTPSPSRAQTPASGSQHFVCNTGYSPDECNLQMAVLRRALGRYPTARLGEWTWVLIRSQDWKGLKERLELDPDSPAFSSLSRRQTFMEEVLVTPVPGRSAELIRHWEMSMKDLLQLAVTHELGHGLCGERDEHKADAYGRMLRAGAEVRCGR